MSYVYFLVSTGLTLWIAHSLTLRFIPEEDSPRRLLGTALGFPLIACSLLLVLGTAGLMTPLGVTIGVLVTSAVLALEGLIRGRRGSPIRQVSTLISGELGLTTTVGWGVLTAAGLPLAVRALGGGPQYSFDDLSYHGTFVATWVRDGWLSYSPFDYHAYYPFYAELFSVWFVLPFSSDAVATFSGAYWAFLLVVAMHVLARGWCGESGAGILSGALVVSSPVVTLAALRMTAHDLAGPAALLAGIAMIPSRSDLADPRRLTPLRVYAGAAAGFALGTRIAFAPAVLMVAAWLLFGARRVVAPRARASNALLFSASAAIAGGYPFLRNLWYTGNPLFPAEMGPWNGPFLQWIQQRTSLFAWIIEAPFSPERWGEILLPLSYWPPGLCIVAAVGYIVGLILVVRRKAFSVTMPAGLLALVFVVGAVTILSFPFTPFSGTWNSPTGTLTPEPRFLILPFAVGILLVSAIAARSPWGERIFVLGAVTSAITSWEGSPVLGAAAVTVAFVVPLFRGAWRGLLGVRRRRQIAGLLAMGAASLAFVVLLPRAERIATAKVFGHERFGIDLGLGWESVEQLPPGARIAAFGSASLLPYPLFGRTFEREVVPVDGVGQRRKLLHVLWKEEPDKAAWWDSPSPGSAELVSLAANLRSEGVTHVLVSLERDGGWPLQKVVLSESEGCTVVSSGDGFALYSIAGPPGPPGRGNTGPAGRPQ